MKEDLKEWISKMTEKIKDSTLVWKNADIAQTLYYLQKQIAISNEIELKKIELQYLNKEIPKYNINSYELLLNSLFFSRILDCCAQAVNPIQPLAPEQDGEM